MFNVKLRISMLIWINPNTHTHTHTHSHTESLLIFHAHFALKNDQVTKLLNVFSRLN